MLDRRIRVVRKTRGRAPASLRRATDAAAAPQNIFRSRLRLPLRPPYDWSAMLAFLRRRAIAGVELVDEQCYHRTVRSGAVHGAIRLRASPDGRSLELAVRLNTAAGLLSLVERVRRMFDLNADLPAVYAVLSKDPLLKQAVTDHRGMRLPGIWEPFEAAVRAIVGQQVSVAAARTLAARLSRRAGPLIAEELAWPGLTHYFPSAAELSAADVSNCGLTPKRAINLYGLARALVDGALELEVGRGLDAFVRALTALPGIGDWTANYIALRGLGEVDAFPAGDLGIIRALTTTAGKPGKSEILRRAEGWRPWRGYAAIYLWSL